MHTFYCNYFLLGTRGPLTLGGPLDFAYPAYPIVTPLHQPMTVFMLLLRSGSVASRPVVRSAPLFLWLIWPMLLLAGSIVDCLILSLWYTGINLFHNDNDAGTRRNDSLSHVPRRRSSESVVMRMLLASFHVIPLLAFCIAFLAWYSMFTTRTRFTHLSTACGFSFQFFIIVVVVIVFFSLLDLRHLP